MKRIIRVFPRKTSATPTDDLAKVNCGPSVSDYADEVHISVAFTYDLERAEELAKEWSAVAPVKIGGPATGDAGGEFIPGMYVKKGYLIHARGCPNSCWFCDVHRNEGRKIRTLAVHEGYNDISSNLLACPESHVRAVINAMKRGKKLYGKRAEFTGGLEALRLQDWHVKLLRELRPKQMFFAYDEPGDLEPLQCAGKMLLDAGWTTASHPLRAYGDSQSASEARIIETIRAGFLPMVMMYRDKTGVKTAWWERGWHREWARAAIVAKKYDEYWRSQ